MAGENIQSKSLEDYIQEAREHTSGEFLKSHEESYFLVGSIPAAGDASQKLAFSTLPGGSLKDLDKRAKGPVVYEITFDKLSSGQKILFGRTGHCTIQIEHPAISKLHGYIKLDFKEKKIVYIDVSKYGSRIDNVKLTSETEYALDSRHTLSFAETPISFQFYSLPDFRDMLESLK